MRQATNVPASLPPLIGRETTLSEALAALGRSRLLTLTGPGGSGKTSLALQMAHELAYKTSDVEGVSRVENLFSTPRTTASEAQEEKTHTDGIWWIELATCRDATHLPTILLSALKTRNTMTLSCLAPHVPTDTLDGEHVAVGEIGGDETIALNTLLAFLQQRRLLLVFDNCEHLLPFSAQFIELLLYSCPHLSVLATSRERLKIPFEQQWPIVPLTVPGVQSAPSSSTIEQALTYSAIQLFVQRASAVVPDFRLYEHQVAAVVEICQILDGLPLAIELAVGCLTFLTPQEIGCHLRQGFMLLADAARTAVPRHQTMEATIAWSYHLLSCEEQVLFRQLSLLAGPFDIEIAVAVANESHEVVVRNLRHLIDIALVSVVFPQGEQAAKNEEKDKERTTRYRLPEMLRHYGYKQVVMCQAWTGLQMTNERSEINETYENYCTWAERFVKAAVAELEGERQTQWLDHLEENTEHLRAAMHWLLQQHQIERALNMMVSLAGFWRQRGYLFEGCDWFDRALAALQVSNAKPSLSIAQAFNALGVLVMWQGAYERAERLHTQALMFFQQYDQRRGMAMTLFRLGFLADTCGNTTSAVMYFDRSLCLFTELADEHGIDLVNNRRGVIAWHQDHYDEAMVLLVRSLDFQRAQGHLGGIASTLLNLGILALEQGDEQQGTVYLEESLALNRRIKDHLATAYTWNYLGTAALQRHDLEQANHGFHEALTTLSTLDLARQSTIPALASRLVDNIAIVAARQGFVMQSARLWGAMKKLRSSYQIDYCYGEQHQLDHDVAAAQHILGEQAFATSWSEGESLRLEETLTCANNLTASLSQLPINSPHSLFSVSAAEPGEQIGQFADSAVFAASASPLLKYHQERAVLEVSSVRPTIQPHPAISGTSILRIHGLGAVRLYQGESLVPTTAFHYTKALELLLYLLTQAACTKAQIALALWPEATPEYIQTTLRVVLYHLRRALGGSQWIMRKGQSYVFNRSLAYWYDIEAVASFLQAAKTEHEANPERAVASLQAALTLMQGDFGEGLAPSDWVLREQERLRILQLEALLCLGDLLLLQGAIRQALAPFSEAIKYDPYCEAGHRGVMRCYLLLQESGAARQHYERLRHSFNQDLAINPSPETQALMQNGMVLDEQLLRSNNVLSPWDSQG